MNTHFFFHLRHFFSSLCSITTHHIPSDLNNVMKIMFFSLDTKQQQYNGLYFELPQKIRSLAAIDLLTCSHLRRLSARKLRK